jgi:hypothetical protein
MIFSWYVHILKSKNAKEFDESNFKKMKNKSIKLKRKANSKK